MKAIQPIGFLFFFILVHFAGNTIQAQHKQEGPDREKAMQEEMEIRKQMLEEQQEQMKEMEIQFAEQYRDMEERSGEPSRTSVSFRSSGYEHDPILPYWGLQENRTELTLRNSFRGGSDSSKGEFDVEKGTRLFRINIHGRVRSGEITVKVKYPGSKVFKELTITSSAEINYSQSLTIKEGEEDKYIGTWTYEVNAEKAEGDYILQISSQ
jgi:hypothetical protein